MGGGGREHFFVGDFDQDPDARVAQVQGLGQFDPPLVIRWLRFACSDSNFFSHGCSRLATDVHGWTRILYLCSSVCIRGESILGQEGTVFEAVALAGGGASGLGSARQGQVQAFAVLAHPADLAGGDAGHEGMGFDVFGDDGAGGDDGGFVDLAAHEFFAQRR